MSNVEVVKACASCFVKAFNSHPHKHRVTVDEAYAKYKPKHNQVHSEFLDVCVDEGMLEVVELMNYFGMKTWMSCQGHERYPKFVRLYGTVEQVHELVVDNFPDWNQYLYYQSDYYLGALEDWHKDKVFDRFNTELRFKEDFPDVAELHKKVFA